MIWVILIWSIKKLLRRFKRKTATNEISTIGKSNLLLLPLILLFTPLNAQDSTISFSVMRNDKSLGTITIQKTTRDELTIYKANNNFQFRFLKKFDIKALESAVFKSQKLIFSEVKRSINGKSHPVVRLEFREGKYLTKKGEHKLELPGTPITSNLLQLYFTEPTPGSRVYCDNQRSFATVRELSEGCYRVDMPNGAHNTFYYKNGICEKIVAVNSIFKVHLIKKPS